MGSAKTYLVGQKEISTHGRLETHSRLDKLTADGTNCLEDTTILSIVMGFCPTLQLVQQFLSDLVFL